MVGGRLFLRLHTMARAFEDPVRYEVAEQTRTLLHDGSATIKTISKCFDRSFSSSSSILQSGSSDVDRSRASASLGALSQVGSHILRSGTSRLEFDSSLGNLDNTEASRISQKRKSSMSPYTKLLHSAHEASQFSFQEKPVAPQYRLQPPHERPLSASTLGRIGRDATRKIYNELSTNSTGLMTMSVHDRLNKMTKQERDSIVENRTKIGQKVLLDHAQKVNQVRCRRAESVLRRQLRKRDKQIGFNVNTGASMIQKQMTAEYLENRKRERRSNICSAVGILRKRRLSTKAKYAQSHRVRKNEQIGKFRSTKQKIASRLKEQKMREEVRVEHLRQSRVLLHRTSEAGFELVDEGKRNEDGESILSYIPKRGSRSMTGHKTLTQSHPQLATAKICVDGSTLFDEDAGKAAPASYAGIDVRLVQPGGSSVLLDVSSKNLISRSTSVSDGLSYLPSGMATPNTPAYSRNNIIGSSWDLQRPSISSSASRAVSRHSQVSHHPPFGSGTGRSFSADFDSVIGQLPPPWGIVSDHHSTG